MRITQKTVQTAEKKDKPYEIRDSLMLGFILRVQPSGVKAYVVEYARGKRVTIGKAGMITLEQAREDAARILRDFASGKEVIPPRKKTQILDGSATLGEFLDKHFAGYCEQHHSRPKEAIGRIKGGFESILAKSLNGITRLDIENARDKRIAAGLKPATIARDLAMLASVFTEAMRIGLLDKHPLRGIRKPKLDKSRVVRYLTNDEEIRLMAALADRDRLRAMVLLSLHTGIRFGELKALRWQDVSMDKRSLTVHGRTAKSGQTRHVPLNRVAVDALIDWMPHSRGDLIFPGKRGDHLDNVRKSWLSVLSEARIEGFRWHDLRHSFASRLVMAGANLNDVRELLGHGSIAMTLRYAHLAPEHKANVVSLLE